MKLIELKELIDKGILDGSLSPDNEVLVESVFRGEKDLPRPEIEDEKLILYVSI